MWVRLQLLGQVRLQTHSRAVQNIVVLQKRITCCVMMLTGALSWQVRNKQAELAATVRSSLPEEWWGVPAGADGHLLGSRLQLCQVRLPFHSNMRIPHISIGTCCINFCMCGCTGA